MKKYIDTIVAVVAGFVTIVAAADRFEKELTVVAGATSVVDIVNLYRPYGAPCSSIDSVFATATTGNGTGTVVFTQYEWGTDTAVSTLTGVRADTANFDRPINKLSSLYTYPVVQNVVTGNYAYAIQNLQTNYVVALSPYMANRIKVRIGQGAVANDTVYKIVIYVKEDPPPQRMP